MSYSFSMATGNNREKSRQRRRVSVEEQVDTLAKHMYKIVNDIKYVVGDLRLLLQQIDFVSRRLDDLLAGRTEHLAAREKWTGRCSCSHYGTAGSNKSKATSIQRAKSGHQQTKYPRNSQRFGEYDVSFDPCDEHLTRDNVMEPDSSSSLEINSMWDNAYDNSVLLTSEVECYGLKSESWLGENLEQSLTSGIEMLSFTDDSEDDYVSSVVPDCQSPCEDMTLKYSDVLSVDPYHVRCKDAIPEGSGRTYCGVYEAAFEACLEPCRNVMVGSESFSSGVSLFGKEEGLCEVSALSYEPTYNTQLNTWIAFTMVAVDSLHTSEDDLSDTALDILNDNLVTTSVLDNAKQCNDNMDFTCLNKSNSCQNRNSTSFQQFGNSDILLC